MLNTVKKNKGKKRGFTLIELVVVLVILGILAAIAIPRLGAVTETASKKADETTARTILSVITMELANQGGNPSNVKAENVTKLVDVDVVEKSAAADGKWAIQYNATSKEWEIYKGTETTAILSK